MKWLKLPRLRTGSGAPAGDRSRRGGGAWASSLRTGFDNPLVMLSVLLFILILGMVLSFLYAQELNRHVTRYDDIVAEQRRLAEGISEAATAAAAGRGEAYERLQRLTADFEERLERLETGAPQEGLPPLPVRLQAETLLGGLRVHLTGVRRGASADLPASGLLPLEEAKTQ